MDEPTTNHQVYEDMHTSADFQELRKKYRAFAIPWTGSPETGTALFPDSDWSHFPLSNPGIVAIPFGFLMGYLRTITSREMEWQRRYDELEVRSLTGVGSEKAVVH